MGKTSSGHVAIADTTKQSCPRSGVGRASLALYRVAPYKILAAVCALFVIFHNFSALSSSPTCPHSRVWCKPARHGAVVSESALCSHHGAAMMKVGGNAADAVWKQ